MKKVPILNNNSENSPKLTELKEMISPVNEEK